MIKGINPNETKDYVSKLDKDLENPTVWTLGCLDPILQAQIEDESVRFEKSSNDPQDTARAIVNQQILNFKIVQFGLKGVTNFLDPINKTPIKIDPEKYAIKGKVYDCCPERIVKMIPPQVRNELAEKLLNWNKFSEDETKN